MLASVPLAARGELALKPVARWLALDLRALALLRISYGLLLLFDLANRMLDIRAHYTDEGICPRASLLAHDWAPEWISLHMASGTWPFQLALFALAALAAVALTFGYLTRFATVLSWCLLCSLHARNPLVLDGGDQYLRCTLFWGMFLPWGERWSLDARQLPSHRTRCWSGATFAYLVQIGCVYWFNALHKWDPIWRTEHTAVYYALMLDQLRTSWAPLLLAHPRAMRGLTVCTLGYEAVAPFLLWSHPWLRGLTALGLSMMHVGFGAFLHLGLFAWVGVLTPVGLWPSPWMDWLETRFRRLAPLWERCPVPPAWLLQRPGRLSSILAACLALFVFNLNLATLRGNRWAIRPPGLRLARTLRLDQSWRMFAPFPMLDDGWYVVDAQTSDGAHVDPWRDGPVRWEKPGDVAGLFRNSRWRRYLMALWLTRHAAWRPDFVRYLERVWNRSHRAHLVRVQLYYVLEKTLPDYRPPEPERILLLDSTCTAENR